LADVIVEGLAQHVCSHPVELVGLVDCTLELHWLQMPCQIDQRVAKRSARRFLSLVV
jgi:hypothetical protein